jgi:asparagine synthase (glutamine-hydrolysing)
MCGLAGSFNRDIALSVIRHRGPDAEAKVTRGKLTLGHTRLAILDLDHRSDQPFAYRDVLLVYNGEVWNYCEVRAELEKLGHTFTTTGDTEVVAAALSEWDSVEKLHGMFALAWTTNGKTVKLARDRFGEIPLHMSLQRPFAFASERRALLAMGCHRASICDVEPGETVEACEERILRRKRYYVPPISPTRQGLDEAAGALRESVLRGCRERAISDVPVCTLLSGGIDSAAIAYGLSKVMQITAYTAVMDPRSRDLRTARIVAEQLGIDLVEVRVPQPTSDDLAAVVKIIEMPYKAQVEIGWACLKLSEAIKHDGYKVVFSGEGSDELWASYGFAYHALKTQDWHEYRRDLFLAQARRNFPRTNKVFMAHSVEARLPFLHVPLVELALSLPKNAVQDGPSKPKAVIQRAFEGLLLDEVTHRPKVAFQDGLGLKQAIAAKLADPAKFYRNEYARGFA